MTKLTTYMKPFYMRMTRGFAIKFLGTVMDLLIPWILAHLIDYIVPQRSVPLIALWGIMMLVCSFFAWVFNVVANRNAVRVSADAIKGIRHDLFKKTTYLSCAKVDEYSSSSLISRLTSDTYNVHRMLDVIQRMGVRAPILLIGGVALTLSLDVALSLVLVSMLPLITIVVFFISRKGIPLYRNLQKKVDKLVRNLRDNITGVRVIKALSKTDYEKDKFSGINTDVMESEKKAARVMASTNPVMNLLLSLGLILVIIVGAYRVDADLTQPGRIIAFLTYFVLILNAMLAITRIFVMVSRGSASFRRIAEILDSPEDLQIEPLDVKESEYHISFNKVSFSYHKIQNDLTDISFDIEKGQTLGIIGPTGSGKSSIIKLLMRFYDCDRGEIRIDGQNVKSIPFDELHEKFGIVFQDDMLFADTISENISFGRDLPERKIYASTKLAQAEEFIDDLDDGLGYKLDIRGANLSGGQKQRILISRALAGNPEILILDDSSSALDYKTDASLRKAIDRNFSKTTTIIIAQRISSVRNADKILVIDEGAIIGRGKHEELMKTCEEYAEIERMQGTGEIS